MRDDRVGGNRFREGRRNQEHLGIPCILIQTIRRSSGVAGYGKEIELIDDDLTYRVIGCAMKVHNTLGSGFQEVIYQRALAIEMERAKIDFGREVEQSIYYRWCRNRDKESRFHNRGSCGCRVESPRRS